MLAKHTTGPEPLSLWLRAFPLRLLVGPIAAALVALTPSLLGDSGPSYFYLVLLMSLYIFHQVGPTLLLYFRSFLVEPGCNIKVGFNGYHLCAKQ